MLARFIPQSFPQATLVAPSLENEFLHNSAQWLALVLLSTTLAAVGLGLTSLSAMQMIVFALVVMIYIPCPATIAACKKEFRWKKSLGTAAVDIALALVLGGLAFRILSLFM